MSGCRLCHVLPDWRHHLISTVGWKRAAEAPVTVNASAEHLSNHGSSSSAGAAQRYATLGGGHMLACLLHLLRSACALSGRTRARPGICSAQPSRRRHARPGKVEAVELASKHLHIEIAESEPSPLPAPLTRLGSPPLLKRGSTCVAASQRRTTSSSARCSSTSR